MFRKCYSMNNIKDGGRVMVGVGYFVRKCYLTCLGGKEKGAASRDRGGGKHGGPEEQRAG